MNSNRPTPLNPLRIGTRGSNLALAQAQIVRDALKREFCLEDAAFEICPVRTKGDKITDKPFRDIGGKGIFCREIEELLLKGGVDIAVHSMKDMPVEQPFGLVIDCVLPRGDPRDAMVSRYATNIAELPDGAVVGTSSVRRKAQVLRSNRKVRVEDIRGNLETRLAKLEAGVVQATMLSKAGIDRSRNNFEFVHVVPTEVMMPAPAQGVICVERRVSDRRVAAFLEAITDEEAHIASIAERSFMSRLEGSCEMPIGAFAVSTGTGLTLRGEVLRPDGSDWAAGSIDGSREHAVTMGRELADSLIRSCGAGFFNGN